MKVLAPLTFLAALSVSFARYQSIDFPDESAMIKAGTDQEQLDISPIMDQIQSKISIATDQAMSHLESILMLKEASHVSKGLRVKVDEFKSKLVSNLERDLSSSAEQVKAHRASQGPLSDDEKYAFTQVLQEKWEKTLTNDLSEFQQNVLPKWVSSVRNVWKGIEMKVMDKIEKFKKYVHKTTPRSSDTCALPSPVLLGSNAISSASKELKSQDDTRATLRRSQDVIRITPRRLLAFFLVVVGTIALTIAAPVWLGVVGLIALFAIALRLLD